MSFRSLLYQVQNLRFSDFPIYHPALPCQISYIRFETKSLNSNARYDKLPSFPANLHGRAGLLRSQGRIVDPAQGDERSAT